ncbi:anthranilate phosphoribosyltransferase [Nonomuraea gerenzanensis]|uniref:Anthranilate phosphoribosyltransferase n=1 Tax=Nonomuraea gerenzanensis TaxID=93944 RepID=A0A1M4EPV2_9ACTN|nr:anthranilate phosphoribosyltransferase [Nonomuraea gerenzanensis]UBU12342.1 anthranilate phosphoribosyltransferase [Nonomuraea gerenzanensis]SBP00886.1 Anthranilate phosphoribosyltransferase [Nonomuraea gerenzanensis]
MTTTWPRILTTLLDGTSLTARQAGWAMDQIMSGLATDAQIAAFAVALRAKGESVAEVSGLADGMLAKAAAIRVSGDPVDLVGTGGDQANTVNVSTMAAIVTAAAGAKVVKHGGRAASSMAGSADVLEELGVVIDLPPADVVRVADEVGITFCFSATFNPALRRTSQPRRELGVPTVFNFLGPLANPALPPAQAVGVYHPTMAPVMAGVLAERGCSALVFRGDDGLDELTTCGPSTIWVVRRGRVTQTSFDPLDLSIPRARPEDLRGGDARHNAAVARAVLSGEQGPVRDIVLLNAAAALVAADGTPPAAELGPALAAGHKRAADAVDSGAALSLLTRWAHATRTVRA